MFNSFHVTFIEHLDSLPSSLLPSTTVELLPDSPPSWDSPSIDPPPITCHLIPVAPSHPPLSSHPSPVSASVPSPSGPSPNCASAPRPSLVSPTSNTVNQNITVLPNTVGHLDQNTIVPTVHHTPTTIHTCLPVPTSGLPATLQPSTIDSPPIPVPHAPPSTVADLPLCRLTRLRFPYSHAATLDGLLPNPQIAAAMLRCCSYTRTVFNE